MAIPFLLTGDWFLKSKKIPLAALHSCNDLDSLNVFCSVHGVEFIKRSAFPKLIQIPKMGLVDGIKVLKTLIIVRTLLTF